MIKFNTHNRAEKCAYEIIEFLLKHEMWLDTSVYANGKRFTCKDPDGHYHYDNNWDCVFVEENVDPKDYLKYTSDFITMTFEGPFYDIINYYNSATYCDRLMEEFGAICDKYHHYYERGYAWSLALYKK